MRADALPDVLQIRPPDGPPDIVVRPPGSKSITNRAVLCAALAEGTSVLDGVLLADDTRAMLACAAGLGAGVDLDEPTHTARITGVRPADGHDAVRLDARQSGTTSRFVLPVAALRPGVAVLDGSPQLRARPFGPLVRALATLGVEVAGEGPDGTQLPLTVRGPARGGRVELSGDVSSQFLSGLLLAGPLMPQGLQVDLTSELVSVP